ncbi:MAG: DUF2330 domain-containing protein [Myxococcales bacterium]
MKLRVLVVGSLTWGLLDALPATAAACGGGGMTTVNGGVVANAQRVILSARQDGTTDTVVQVSVPITSADYGVLIPVPSEPTLDDEPVSASDLDALDQQTAPRIYKTTAGGGSSSPGCSCGSANDDDSAGAAPSKGVSVSSPVEIGPVTAVSLTADDADAVKGWLADNGFVIPDERLALLDQYVSTGRYFIAIRRSDSATSSSPSSIGIHYTLKGDHRLLSLAFARLGAAPSVSFTVFVASPSSSSVSPSAPFQALTLADLDANLLRADNYSGAVQTAVKAHGAQAFVLENTTSLGALEARPPAISIHSVLRRIFDNGSTITRMSTVLAADDLTQDASFFGPRQPFQSERYVQNDRSSLRHASVGLVVGLAAAGLFRRRRRS